MAEWQPSESAPRDGTAVMLANKHGAWIGHYVDRYVSGYVPDAKWHTLMLNHRHIPQPARDKSYRPTHWQPLPAPPKESPH